MGCLGYFQLVKCSFGCPLAWLHCWVKAGLVWLGAEPLLPTKCVAAFAMEHLSAKTRDFHHNWFAVLWGPRALCHSPGLPLVFPQAEIFQVKENVAVAMP